MLMQPDSLVGKRAFFASKHLFVTPYDEDQYFAAGTHVVQTEDCLGLKQWTKEVRAEASPVHIFGSLCVGTCCVSACH